MFLMKEESWEIESRQELYNQIKSDAVIFTWLENMIDILNDSQIEQANRLRKRLTYHESKLRKKINKMNIVDVMKELNIF